MKLNEMNEHQKTLVLQMRQYMSDMIGGCENTLQDYPEDSAEYKEASNYLSQGHENLKQDIYEKVMNACPKEGRFAGKQFLLDRIESNLNKWGY